MEISTVCKLQALCLLDHFIFSEEVKMLIDNFGLETSDSLPDLYGRYGRVNYG